MLHSDYHKITSKTAYYLQGKHCFFWGHPRCFGPLGKFQHNIKISIKTDGVSRLSVFCHYDLNNQIISIKVGTVNDVFERNVDLIINEILTLENQFNTLSTKKNEFIDKTEDEEINDKNEKGQSEVTKRLNIALTENYINPWNMKTIHGNRMYASTTKLGKKYVLSGTVILNVLEKTSSMVQ